MFAPATIFLQVDVYLVTCLHVSLWWSAASVFTVPLIHFTGLTVVVYIFTANVGSWRWLFSSLTNSAHDTVHVMLATNIYVKYCSEGRRAYCWDRNVFLCSTCPREGAKITKYLGYVQ